MEHSKNRKKEGLSDYLTICIEFNCNNNCISCMIKGIKEDLKPISFKKYKEILNNNLKLKKYNNLILSGAEVTMNKNLLKFVEYAKNSKNIKHIRIQTNARKLSDYKYCKSLIDAGVDEFFISIYSHDRKIHESITRSKGSFNETMKGIENINKLGRKIITNTVITSLNYKFLPDIVRGLSSFNNIKEMQFWNYWPMSESDNLSLLESFPRIKPFLINTIKECTRRGIKVIINNFPECLLGKFEYVLDNSQPDTKIDKLLWDKYNLNSFGQCLFKNYCKSKKCGGLTTAYIEKFGWEEDIFNPIKNQSNGFVEYKDNNQIKKYVFHKETFNIKNTVYLKEFENLLNASQDYRLECSCKIEGKKTYPTRFDIWYNNVNVKNINLIFNFFKKVSKCPRITINYDLIKKVFDKNFSLEKVEQMVTGIDYRRKINESRLKMWFIIKDYPEKMEQVLSIYGYDKKVSDLIVNDRLLFGFDFYFDGRTKIKIYAIFDQKDLDNTKTLKKLKNIFSAKIFGLIEKCDELHISFRGKDYKKILHFHPRRRELFVKELNNKKLEKISSLIKNKNFGNKGVVSLCEDEINNNSTRKLKFSQEYKVFHILYTIKNVNIYY